MEDSLGTKTIPEILEASYIFLLMKKEYRISRNIRAQWYLSHLNKCVRIKCKKKIDECHEEISVISAVPKTKPTNWSIETSEDFQYLVSPGTRVIFLSRCYRLVFCLDLSPSTAAVDIQNGIILFDEVFTALKQSLIKVSQPFYVPSSQFLFQPEIYITVLAHMPFYAQGGEQVLVQGWCLKSSNVNELLKHACNQFQVGKKIVEATSILNEERAKLKLPADNLTGGLFDEVKDVVPITPQITITTPDINTVNMLRYGILALQLLPENTSAGIIVITDGMLTLPNTVMLESLLTQLRNNTIACSFIHVGSSYHPFSSLGFVPYSDLMQFIATATLGAYLPCVPNDNNKPNVNELDINVYHKAFLTWNFQGGIVDEEELTLNKSGRKPEKWMVLNQYFGTKFDQSMMRKRQKEGSLQVSLSSVLSCRLREGYTVKFVHLEGEHVEITLTLPWKFNASIEYTLSALSPSEDSRDKIKHPCCRYEIVIEGIYDFLHDVTCSMKKKIESPYRAAVVKQFWSTMKNLTDTDQLLVHLQSFGHNPTYFTIPESIKNGLPLFYLAPNATSPTLSSKNLAHHQFANFWRPICMLDINIWQKWMHTHRIGIILEHDRPLIKNVHIPNNSGRYNIIQCRQALTSLNALLRDFSSFVLIENHSYIKFLTTEPDKPPYSFYIIRVSSKAPCMVIRLAFLGGMSGKLRNEIENELRNQILNLKFPRRGTSKGVRVISESGNSIISISSGASRYSKSPLERDWMDVNCCVILKKPVEKILIKYGRVPNDFYSPISSQVATGSDPLATNMLTTLSSYLHNQRWIWNMQATTNSPLPLTAVAEILNTLIMLRLEEGFHFAHSHSGIINLVLEVGMEHCVDSEDDKVHPCVVQYIIFPPFSNTSLRDSISEDDDGEFESTEADGELQIITECWIEPQDGKMQSGLPRCEFMRGLTFQQMAKSSKYEKAKINLQNTVPEVNEFLHLEKFLNIDITCVSSLVTFHHLLLMCRNDKVPSPYIPSSTIVNTPVVTPVVSDIHSFQLSAARSTPDFNLSQASGHSHQTVDENTSNLKFPFELISLLPYCQQAELIFSTYVQDLIPNLGDLNETQDVQNTVLYTHLLEMLMEAHDRELNLTDRDNVAFPHHVLERKRPSRVYRVPFPASDISFDACRDFASDCHSSWDHFKRKKSPSKSLDHSPEVKGGGHFESRAEDVYFDPLPKWKCFVKALTDTHLLVTVMPASYEDLKLLILGSAGSSDMPNYLGSLPYKAVRVVKRGHDAENAHLADESHQTSGGEGRTATENFGSDAVDGSTQSSTKKTEPERKYSTVIFTPPSPKEIDEDCVGVRTPKFPGVERIEISEPPYEVPGRPTDLLPRRYSNEIYGSLTLPIYCYHCSLSSVSSQIVSKDDRKRWKDIYHDFCYKMDEVNYAGDDPVAAKSNSASREGSKQPSPEPKSEHEIDNAVNHQQLKEVARVIENIYSKSFVQGVFKCLQLGYRVDSQDIEAAVDSICVESILEIDISPFLQVICGHVRDFHFRTLVELQNANQDDSKENRNKVQQRHFSLDALQRFLPCEQLKQLHNSIKEQFSETIQLYFKPISTHPDYAYFAPFDDLIDDTEDNDEKFMTKEKEVNDDENNQLLDDIEFTSEADTKESETDISSPPNHSHYNPDNDEDNVSIIEAEPPIAPLFVHLTCTLKYKNNVGSCSLMSLPTCLSEIISCLEGENLEVDLSNLQITLDFICLTLDSENDRTIHFPKTSQRNLSYCSSASPILEVDTTTYTDHSSDHLKDLPPRQYDSVQTCVQKVKWLLQDEIAAAALQNYPLTEPTLEMVIEHVTESVGIDCCCMEEVPLIFVFGSEISLEKFKQEFDKIWTSLPGYHLEKENDYYYLVRNEDIELQPVTQQHQNNDVIEFDPVINAIRKTPIDQRRSPYIGDDPEIVEINKRSLSMIPSVFDTNISLGPTSTSQYSEFRASSSSFFSEIKSFSKELSNIPECLTTNDEEEADEADNRKRGRSKPSRKSSARSSRERVIYSGNEAAFDKPPSFTDINLKDDVMIVKPLATKGRLSLTPESPNTIKRMEIPVDNSSFVKVQTMKAELTESSETIDSRGFSSSQALSETSSVARLPRTSEVLDCSSVDEIQNSTSTENTTSDEKAIEVFVVDSRLTPSKGDSTVTSSRTVSKNSTPGLEYNPVETREGAESLEVAKIQESAAGLDIKDFFSASRKILLGRTDSCNSTPFMYSEGGRVSNTEDGYEGDSSDSGSELGWLNVRRSLLPKFWLIKKIHQDRVVVYFHIRHRKNEDDELRNAKDLFKKAIKTVKNLCKLINQTMLLQDLHDTHMCHQLLVPEASEDIWRQDETRSVGTSTRLHSIDIDPNDSYDNQNSEAGYLEAEMKFKPGAFDCPIVWTTYFYFHPRLSSGPGRNTMSKGVQALRSALTSFSVINRKNMFVYKELSGSVFYLRLHESMCSGFKNGATKNEDDKNFGGSRSSSVHSLPQKKTPIEAEDDFGISDFRPRVNSALSDKDQSNSHETSSITSRVSSNRKINQQCIALNFHGIGEVDTPSKEDLVKLLQNELDEAVLEVITVMLARNAKSKLTPEDVQFIQKPGKEPTFVLHFTVHSNTLQLLGPLVFYLRQNLLSFLHNPNYTDNKMENHFQPYNSDSNLNYDFTLNFSDEDVFLYSIQQAFGMSGNKGIACIILSLVDGQGKPVRHVAHRVPSPTAYQDSLMSHDHEELTGTSLFQFNPNKKSPGPIALIRFQIWCVGKVQQELLTGKLGAAMRHALWDLLMEYRLLTSPLAQPMEGDNCESISEPSTPIKRRRRSGRIISEQTREFDISSKTYSPTLSPTDSLYIFKYAGTMNVDTPSSMTSSLSSSKIGALSSMIQPEPRNMVYDAGDKGRLTDVFSSSMKEFLDFGKTIGVPTVVSNQYTLNSQHQIPFLLQQFQSTLQDSAPDIVSKVFLKQGMDFLPYNTQLTAFSSGVRPDKLPGKSQDFIVVGRNLNLWRAFMGSPEHSSYLGSSLLKQQKHHQRFQPFIPGAESGMSSSLTRTANATPTSCLGSPTQLGVSTPISIGPFTNLNPHLTSTNSSESLSSLVPFIPRQRLLLIVLEGNSLTLYLYNWLTEVSNSIFKLLTKLVDWFNQRGLAISSIVCQKMGIFHNQSLFRNKTKDKNSSVGFAPPNPSMVKHLEILLSNTAPPNQAPGSEQPITTRKSSSFIVGATFDSTIRDKKPLQPVQCSDYKNNPDLAMRFSLQLKDIQNTTDRKVMEDLHRVWKSRDPHVNIPYLDKVMHSVKQVARLSHFCLTPILFSPTWRWKVAPVRDHTLEPVIQNKVDGKDVSPFPISSRSRHSSGSSVKSSIETSSSNNSLGSSLGRMRKISGNPLLASVMQKPRRSQMDEECHFAICTTYIQEYIEYLQTLGFVAIQTGAQTHRQMKNGKNKDEARKSSQEFGKKLRTSNNKGLPVFLIKNLLGGLLIFEVGFCDPYAYAHLYSLESKRLLLATSPTQRSQFTTVFLDQLDKIKITMHLHSFTYDFHLRTIYSYISGRHLLFRQGYHISNFLDDFIKYYQKSPNFARNLISSGTLVIPNTRVEGSQLYNYIISHNQHYGMTVVRMEPMFKGSDIDTEFALVELSSYKGSYKDANDINHVDNFDVGLLVTFDKEANHQQFQQQHILVLKFYILLTSQRDLYPKLVLGSMLGSFQPVRLGANKSSSLAGSQSSSRVPSRKSSNINTPNQAELTSSTEKDAHNRESVVIAALDDVSRKVSSIAPPTMCDEEVTYLGYFSSHETLMLNILKDRTKTTRKHLEAIVGRAGVHCCRDFLWSCLFPRTTDTKEMIIPPMSYSQFRELLSLVTSVPINDIDKNLTPFLNMSHQWYINLTKLLLSRFSNTSRLFISPDGNTQHLVLTDIKCPDSFIKLTMDQQENRAEISFVFREPLLNQEHSPDKPNFRVLALQSLVEVFVNHCCYHLWTGLLG